MNPRNDMSLPQLKLLQELIDTEGSIERKRVFPFPPKYYSPSGSEINESYVATLANNGWVKGSLTDGLGDSVKYFITKDGRIDAAARQKLYDEEKKAKARSRRSYRQ